MTNLLKKFKLKKQQDDPESQLDRVSPEDDPKLQGAGKAVREEDLLDDEGRPIPHWREQVTIRAVVCGWLWSLLFSIMTLK